MHSLKDFDSLVVAQTCIFLAGKVEENPKKLRDVLLVAHRVRFKGQEGVKELQIDSAEYNELREEVLRMEGIVLQTLSFDLSVQHVYKFLQEYANKNRTAFPPSSRFPQVAWNFANDSLRTTLCLQCEPKVIAAGCVYLAGKFLKMSPPGDWLEFFDVSVDKLGEITGQILDLYDKKQASGSSSSPPPPGTSPSGSTSPPPEQKSSGTEEKPSAPPQVKQEQEAPQPPPAPVQQPPAAPPTQAQAPQLTPPPPPQHVLPSPPPPPQMPMGMPMAYPHMMPIQRPAYPMMNPAAPAPYGMQPIPMQPMMYAPPAQPMVPQPQYHTISGVQVATSLPPPPPPPSIPPPPPPEDVPPPPPPQ